MMMMMMILFGRYSVSSAGSALEVSFNEMRYINLRFTQWRRSRGRGDRPTPIKIPGRECLFASSISPVFLYSELHVIRHFSNEF